MTSRQLIDVAEETVDHETFVRFVEYLSSQWRTFENPTLETFLRGLAGFTRDMQSYYANLGEPLDMQGIPWRTLARMLTAATVYE